MVTKVKDPLGNEVHVPENLCNEWGEILKTEEIYDDVCAVIQKPAMLFQVRDGKVENYYFRAIGWNKSLLVGTVSQDGNYTAFECRHNPSATDMQNILLAGKRLIWTLVFESRSKNHTSAGDVSFFVACSVMAISSGVRL